MIKEYVKSRNTFLPQRTQRKIIRTRSKIRFIDVIESYFIVYGRLLLAPHSAQFFTS